MSCTHFDEKTHRAYLARIDPKDRQREDDRLRAYAGVELVPAPKRSQIYVSEYRQSGGDFRYVNQDNSLGQSWTELHKPVHSTGGYRPLPEAFVEQAMAAKERYAKDPTVSKVYMVSPAVRSDGVVQHPGSEYSYVVEINFLSDKNGGTRMVVIHREGPKDAKDLRQFFIALTGRDPVQSAPLRDGDTGFDLVIVRGNRASGDQFKTPIGEGIVTLYKGRHRYEGKGRFVDPYAAMKLPRDEKNNPSPTNERQYATSSETKLSPETQPVASREERPFGFPEQTQTKVEPIELRWVSGSNNYQQPLDQPVVHPYFGAANSTNYNQSQLISNEQARQELVSYPAYIPEYLRSYAIQAEARVAIASHLSKPEPQFHQEVDTQRQPEFGRSPPLPFARTETPLTEKQTATHRLPKYATSAQLPAKRVQLAKEIPTASSTTASRVNLQSTDVRKQMLRGAVQQSSTARMNNSPKRKIVVSAKPLTSTVKSALLPPKKTEVTLNTQTRESTLSKLRNFLKQATIYFRSKLPTTQRATEPSPVTLATRIHDSIMRLRAYLIPQSPTSITSRVLLKTQHFMVRTKQQALAYIPNLEKIKLLPKLLRQQVQLALVKIKATLADTLPSAKFTTDNVTTTLRQSSPNIKPKQTVRRRIDEIFFLLEQLRRNLFFFLYTRRRKLRGYSVVRWITRKPPTRSSAVRDAQ
jgi:hypothetical protein